MPTDFSSLDLANLEESAERTAGLRWGFRNFLLKSESPAERKNIPKVSNKWRLSREIISLSSWNSNKLRSGKLILAVANPPFGCYLAGNSWIFSMSKIRRDSQPKTCGVNLHGCVVGQVFPRISPGPLGPGSFCQERDDGGRVPTQGPGPWGYVLVPSKGFGYTCHFWGGLPR